LKIDRKRLSLWGRRAVLFLLDMFLVFLAIELAAALRYDGSISGREFKTMHRKIMPLIPLFIGIYMTALTLGGTYVSRWRYAGTRDLARLCTVCALAAGLTVAMNYAFRWHISRMILMVTGMLAAAFVGGSRFVWKMCREAILSHSAASGARVLIVGGGESGVYAARLCQEGNGVAGVPVGFVDDDPANRGCKIHDLPVLGTTKDIPDIVRRKDISEIIIAPHGEMADRVGDIADVCRRTRCKVRIMSEPGSLDASQPNTFRELNFSDFLPRSEVKLDPEGIRGYITGRVVMVTGGGGSIGSEICRQIMRFAPQQLIIFDIYENCAYELENELKGRYGADCPIKVLIGSIRDRARLDEVFDTYDVDIVFHAAAHKHVPLMEDSPAEAIKNNVFGTRNLLSSASEHGVRRLVQLSTDKAVNPTNVMGATKRVTEMLIQQFARRTKMKCMAVRFGNVLGSHGSVIPLFESQIKRGGPVLVTHPDITRYFMTIPEAAQLVLQAGAIADNGAIYVLDMAQPVKMMDLAKQVIRFYGYTPNVDMPIKISGLRPGEKLYEELMMDNERDGMRKTVHNKIFVAPPIPMDDDELDARLEDLKAAAAHNDDEAVEALCRIVTTYRPSRNSIAG
jgi:FlaA1/EpsC-like NDP-sugar epimerase